MQFQDILPGLALGQQFKNENSLLYRQLGQQLQYKHTGSNEYCWVACQESYNQLVGHEYQPAVRSRSRTPNVRLGAVG